MSKLSLFSQGYCRENLSKVIAFDSFLHLMEINEKNLLYAKLVDRTVCPGNSLYLIHILNMPLCLEGIEGSPQPTFNCDIFIPVLL